jgi:hypothetical protein
MTRKQQDHAMLPPAFHPHMAEAWVVAVKLLNLRGGTGQADHAKSREIPEIKVGARRGRGGTSKLSSLGSPDRCGPSDAKSRNCREKAKVNESKERIVGNSTRTQSPTEPCAIRTPNDQDLGVLVSLAAADRRFSIGRGREFVRPMDIGKSTSASLARLEKHSLVFSRPRGLKYSAMLHPSRVTREYKITEAGLATAKIFDSRVNASITCSHIEKETK